MQVIKWLKKIVSSRRIVDVSIISQSTEVTDNLSRDNVRQGGMVEDPGRENERKAGWVK